MISKKELITFENEIAEIYATGAIRGPIHQNDPNQFDALIEIFKQVRPEDYVFATWRSHGAALLKGVPKDLVKAEILAGRSITLEFPKFNFYTSAIVGGIGPIATGAAYALKKQSKKNRVFCIIGDMAALSGITMECMRYSFNNRLPLYWIIENNGKSVGTPTFEAWGEHFCLWQLKKYLCVETNPDYSSSDENEYFDQHFQSYDYEMNISHAGIGQFVSF